MKTTTYVYRNGSPVPQGFCVLPDHYVTTIQVTLRSSTPISPETLRTLIQQRHEVIGLTVESETCIVQNTPHKD